MRYRKLRIAWSVGCGIACLLLVVLWVRSYTWQDGVISPGTNMWSVTSRYGKVSIVHFSAPNRPYLKWRFTRNPANQVDLSDPETNALGFGYKRYASGAISVTFRCWLGLIAFTILAAIPWVARKELRYRFSLRMLLIGMTVLAVLLGAVVWAVR